MRYIRVQDKVTIRNLRNGVVVQFSIDANGMRTKLEPVSYADFILSYVLDTKVFGAGFKALTAGTRIYNKFIEAEVGSIVEIAENDWLMMKAALEEDKVYAPMQTLQLVHLFDTVMKAPESHDEVPDLLAPAVNFPTLVTPTSDVAEN